MKKTLTQTPGKSVQTRPKQKKAAPLVPKDVRKRAFQMKLERFADEYLIDLNGTAAAVRAGYSKHTAEVKASQLLARADVQGLIEKREYERSERTQIKADNVLRDMYAIATADAAEFSEIRIGCCRYCYGQDHRYQRTPKEIEVYRQEWEAKITKAHKGESPDRIAELIEEFDPEGGTGFDKRKTPHSDCPECFGEGEARAVFHDTETMSPAARRAFGGVKSTDKSIEIRMRDQDAMLIKVAEHLGMFKKRIELNAGDGTDTKSERAYVIIPAKAPPSDEPIG